MDCVIVEVWLLLLLIQELIYGLGIVWDPMDEQVSLVELKRIIVEMEWYRVLMERHVMMPICKTVMDVIINVISNPTTNAPLCPMKDHAVQDL